MTSIDLRRTGDKTPIARALTGLPAVVDYGIGNEYHASVTLSDSRRHERGPLRPTFGIQRDSVEYA
jgi:hypothetical protein